MMDMSQMDNATLTLSYHLTIAENLFMWLFKEKLNYDNAMQEFAGDRHPHEKYFIGMITLSLAIINFTITFAVTITLFRVRSLHNSFGYLNISHGIADCLVLLIFIVWYAPMIVLDKRIDQTLVAMKIAHFTGICMCGAIHSTMFIAAGRYNALVHPLKYSTMFTRKRTLQFIVIAWATAFGHHMMSFLPPCFYYFDFRHYAWFHADTVCGEFLSWFVDLCYGLNMIALIAGIDVATFYQLRKTRKTRNPLMRNTRLSQKHFSREWRLFIQSMLSSGIIMIIFLTFHLVKKTMSFRFVHFLSGCVCVIIVHGTNAIVLIAFNVELRQRLCELFNFWSSKGPAKNRRKSYLPSELSTDYKVSSCVTNSSAC